MDNDAYNSMVRAAIERRVQSHLNLCRKAGHPIDRRRAHALVQERLLEELRQEARKLDHAGDSDGADAKRNLAAAIPEYFAMLGLR